MGETSTTHVDIVVIGAGPAGSAAAVTALARGARVALIDKARFPREKLCGGLITGRCANHLRDVFDQEIDDQLFQTRDRFQFFMETEHLADMSDAPPAHLTMRWDFDHALFQRAIDDGALDYSGRRLAKLDLEAAKVTLNDGESVQFRCLIGADGVRSRVAEALFGESFEAAEIGFALEIEDTRHPPVTDAPIRVDFAAAAWGYGWSFPKRHSTTIGVGGLHAQNPDMKARLSDYLAQLGTEADAKVKGHFLPFGGFRNTPGRANILLAGDAAGFVDPITGEGIGYAIQSGALAGQAAADAIAKGHPEGAADLYQPSTRGIRRAIRSARLLRPIMFAGPLRPFFVSAFRSSRTLKSDYMRLLAGQTEYSHLLRRAALRLPSAAVRFAMRKLTRSEHRTQDQRAD
ncbi:MAG: geranylgeranyl reductase family protein [Pseudomonadota bacterium]